MGNSIYVDPDGVTEVSNRLLQLADNIQYTHSSIASQIQYAINMSYSMEYHVHGIQALIWSAQENLNYFNSLSGMLFSDVQTAVYGLRSVANSARSNIGLLEKGANLAYSNVVQVVEGFIDGTLSSQTMKALWGDLDSTQSYIDFVEEIVDQLGSDDGGGISGYDILSTSVHTLTELMEGGTTDPREITSTILAGGVELAAGLIPGETEVSLGLDVMHYSSLAMEFELQSDESIYHGTALGDQISQSADILKQASDDASLDPVSQDSGKLLVDGAIGAYNWLTGNDSANQQDGANLVGDLSDLGNDSLKTVDSVPLFLSGTLAYKLEQDNDLVQNLPLPSGIKDISNNITTDGLTAINDTGNSISYGITKGIPNVLHDGWNMISNNPALLNTFAFAVL